MKDVIYYESHITIEPVFDKDIEIVDKIVRDYGFRLANLLMKKRSEDTIERSQYDTFTTARGSDYHKLYDKMNQCSEAIIKAGYHVWRKKIEAVLFDERTR